MIKPPGKELDRFLGALIGLAAGDAVGTTVEFKSPGSFDPVVDMKGGGPFGLKPGQWTDDTSLALCLAESLVECEGRFDPRHQLKTYDRWSRTGHLSSNGTCFDIGSTTSRALRTFRATGEPYCGPTDPGSAGNGSIMRLAPVPMLYRLHPALAASMSGESSRTTHGAPEAVDACRYLGVLIAGAIQGASKEDLLAETYSPVSGMWDAAPLSPRILDIAKGSYKRSEPPEIQGTGYVVKSLEAALWAFRKSSSFKDAILKAVNLGDDADTTAAVCGQLAGAHHGLSGIPETWLEKLALRDKILELGNALYRLSTDPPTPSKT